MRRARSTVSTARSTPAQYPRGHARRIVFGTSPWYPRGFGSQPETMNSPRRELRAAPSGHGTSGNSSDPGEDQLADQEAHDPGHRDGGEDSPEAQELGSEQDSEQDHDRVEVGGLAKDER